MIMRSFGVLAVVLCVTTALQSQMQSLGRNESFAVAKLSAREIRQILGGVEQSAYDTPDSWQTELRLRRVDLGGSAGLVVQGSSMLCGGTGNCQTWVFRKSNDHWISMMAGDQAPIVSAFAFGPGVTRGIPDLTIVANLSATDSKRTTFRFDGKFYRAQ
jgi:hypothetical protein